MRPLVVALILLLSSCSPATHTSEDAGALTAKRPVEELFGNSRQIVTDFARLKTCVKQEQLDRTCPPYQALQRHLKAMATPQKKRARLIFTLSNLLSSHSKLSRRVAAESLFPFREGPSVIKALKLVLKKEKDPRAAAVMLRQLCQGSRKDAASLALPYLAPSSPAQVKIEAAACLGLTPQLSPRALKTLRDALRQDGPPRLKISLCAALGALRAKAALPELAAQLALPEASGPCSAALAAIGTEGAYQALSKTLGQQSRISAQTISALLSLQGQPFFEKEDLIPGLTRIVSAKQLDWTIRSRAVGGLLQLGERKSLKALATRLAQQTDEGDALILEQIRLHLGPGEGI